MVDTVHEGYLTWPEFSKPVLQYRLVYSKVCEGCVQKCTHLSSRNPPSKAVARYAISHCGDSIEGKPVTAVDELKCPDCGNATEETEKDAEVEKSDCVDENTIDLDKLKLSKKRPKEVFEHDEHWQIITKGSKQPLEDATDETLVRGLNNWIFRIFKNN